MTLVCWMARKDRAGASFVAVAGLFVSWAPQRMDKSLQKGKSIKWTLNFLAILRVHGSWSVSISGDRTDLVSFYFFI